MNSCLCLLVQVLKNFFSWVSRTLFAKCSLAVITLHVAEDGQALRIEIVIHSLLLSHTSSTLWWSRSRTGIIFYQFLLDQPFKVEFVCILVESRFGPVIHVWILNGRRLRRWWNHNFFKNLVHLGKLQHRGSASSLWVQLRGDWLMGNSGNARFILLEEFVYKWLSLDLYRFHLRFFLADMERSSADPSVCNWLLHEIFK